MELYLIFRCLTCGGTWEVLDSAEDCHYCGSHHISMSHANADDFRETDEDEDDNDSPSEEQY